MIATIGDTILFVAALWVGFMLLGVVFEIGGAILGLVWSLIWGTLEFIFEVFCECLLFIFGGAIMLWQLFTKTIERRRKYGRQL